MGKILAGSTGVRAYEFTGTSLATVQAAFLPILNVIRSGTNLTVTSIPSRCLQ